MKFIWRLSDGRARLCSELFRDVGMLVHSWAWGPRGEYMCGATSSCVPHVHVADVADIPADEGARRQQRRPPGEGRRRRCRARWRWRSWRTPRLLHQPERARGDRGDATRAGVRASGRSTRPPRSDRPRRRGSTDRRNRFGTRPRGRFRPPVGASAGEHAASSCAYRLPRRISGPACSDATMAPALAGDEPAGGDVPRLEVALEVGAELIRRDGAQL